jgi:hypothetical protein
MTQGNTKRTVRREFILYAPIAAAVYLAHFSLISLKQAHLLAGMALASWMILSLHVVMLGRRQNRSAPVILPPLAPRPAPYDYRDEVILVTQVDDHREVQCQRQSQRERPPVSR